MPAHPASPLQYLIPLLILVPVLALRARKMFKSQPLKLGLLWLRPVAILAATATLLFAHQPGQPPVHFTLAEWAVLAAVAAAGCVAGWHYGRTMAIEVHPENGTLMVKGSALALLIFIGLVAVKLALKPALAAEGKALHWDAQLITDALIVFSAGLFTVRAVEMYLRARRVMKASQGTP